MVIDLHGMIEQEAIGYVLSAVFDVKNTEGLEIEIITGNGHVLKDLVIDMVEEEGLSWRHEGSNYGSMIIFE